MIFTLSMTNYTILNIYVENLPNYLCFSVHNLNILYDKKWFAWSRAYCDCLFYAYKSTTLRNSSILYFILLFNSTSSTMTILNNSSTIEKDSIKFVIFIILPFLKRYYNTLGAFPIIKFIMIFTTYPDST